MRLSMQLLSMHAGYLPVDEPKAPLSIELKTVDLNRLHQRLAPAQKRSVAALSAAWPERWPIRQRGHVTQPARRQGQDLFARGQIHLRDLDARQAASTGRGRRSVHLPLARSGGGPRGAASAGRHHSPISSVKASNAREGVASTFSETMTAAVIFASSRHAP
jgi:hypothetical protein